MKYTITILAILVIFQAAAQKSAQRDLEIGAIGGISWYNGDLNSQKIFGRDYINKAYGVSIRKNLNRRFALRSTAVYSTLGASDQVAKYSAQALRNLSFKTKIYELGGLLEFNFLEYDAMINHKRFTPYSFVGLSVFRFNPTTEVEGSFYELQPLQTENKKYSLVSIAIPFGFGFKYALTDRFIINTDWGMRRTFTDYLDDVSSDYPYPEDLDGLSENLSDRSLEQTGPDGTNWGTQRGNAKTKDWYSFVTLGLSIRIGPKKGSCKHIGI
ncbi:MAG: DUF6089 family protein [Flavobacteriales bacterium]